MSELTKRLRRCEIHPDRVAVAKAKLGACTFFTLLCSSCKRELPWLHFVRVR